MRQQVLTLLRRGLGPLRGELAGAKVLDVGALDVNGSMRETMLDLGVGSYLGIDLTLGPNVDLVCDVTRLHELLKATECFDVVISSDTLEHVHDWRGFVGAMKDLCKPFGYMMLCAAPVGFGRHDYPHDYWRFTLETLRAIFSDCTPIDEEPSLPGVLVRKGKRQTADLEGIELEKAP